MYVYLFRQDDVTEEQVEALTKLDVKVELDEEHDLYRLLFVDTYQAEETLLKLNLLGSAFDSWYEDEQLSV